jgi:hypothetical protein
MRTDSRREIHRPTGIVKTKTSSATGLTVNWFRCFFWSFWSQFAADSFFVHLNHLNMRPSAVDVRSRSDTWRGEARDCWKEGVDMDMDFNFRWFSIQLRGARWLILLKPFFLRSRWRYFLYCRTIITLNCFQLSAPFLRVETATWSEVRAFWLGFDLLPLLSEICATFYSTCLRTFKTKGIDFLDF